MNTNDYPNRDALRHANDIYLDVMRSFIIHNLRQVKGENVEQLIEKVLYDNQIEQFRQMIKEHNDIGSAIDFTYIPHIIKDYWEDIFSNKFENDLVAQNMLWLIRKGRNKCEHRATKDLDIEFTRTHLYLISDILRIINRTDKMSEVNKIRDEFLADNAVTQISEITEQLETEKTEKKKHKKDYEKVAKQLENLENQYNTDKEHLNEVKKQLSEAKSDKEKADENLINIRKDLKTTEKAWIEADKSLKSKMADLQTVENEKNNIVEKYETLKKQYENVEKENKENLTSIENQLLVAKTEKSCAEERIATLVNPVFPLLDSDSDVYILDRRGTDRKKYIINLLETKKPSIIYVHDNDKIKQLLSFVGDETATSIRIHNNRTSADEEKELLTKLEHDEINTIVSDAIITSLPEQHTVEHFIICHPVLCFDEFTKRCEPAFNSNKDAYIHLIYDSTQDFQDIVEELNHKYLDREVLIDLYKGTETFVTANNSVVDIDSLHDDLDLEKSGIATGLAIFEELGFIERNAEKIKFLKSNVKRKLEDSHLYCEGKKLKEKVNRESYQLGMDSIENIWDKILDTLDIEEKHIIHEQPERTYKTNNGSQHETEVDETDSAETEQVDIPKHSRAKVNAEQVRDIRERAADGETLSNLSKEYGMSSTGIWNIVNRNTWKDVE